MNIKRIGAHALAKPQRANAHDLGYDLSTTVAHTLQPGERFRFPTGFGYQFPPHTGAIIKPRSGLADKYGIDVLAGVVDGGYQGEVQVILINHGSEPLALEVGDRIAQMLIVMRVTPSEYGPELVEVDAFVNATDRGIDGFGSTGIKAAEGALSI